MVRLIPEEPDVHDRVRARGLGAAARRLGPDDVLLANLRLTDETKDHEADLVVLMPEVGVLVLEVKGGSVWYDDDGWWIRRRGQDTRDRPGRPGARRRSTRCAQLRRARPALGQPRATSPGRTAS